MSTEKFQEALTRITSQRDEEQLRNLGATVEALMRRRGFDPQDLVAEDVVEELTQDDFELAS